MIPSNGAKHVKRSQLLLAVKDGLTAEGIRSLYSQRITLPMGEGRTVVPPTWDGADLTVFNPDEQECAAVTITVVDIAKTPAYCVHLGGTARDYVQPAEPKAVIELVCREVRR